MSITRSFLKSLQLNEDQVQSIIDEYTPVTADLKKYKEEAEKLPDVQKQLDKALKDLDLANGWKTKYETEHADFEAFKTATSEKESAETKKSLYRAMLKEASIADEWIDRILKVTDFNDFELKDGKLADEDDIKKSIETEYAGYVKTTKTGGAKVENPPKGGKETEDDNSEYIKKKVAEHNATFYGAIVDKGEKK